jgi:hypothetical protein
MLKDQDVVDRSSSYCVVLKAWGKCIAAVDDDSASNPRSLTAVVGPYDFCRSRTPGCWQWHTNP